MVVVRRGLRESRTTKAMPPPREERGKESLVAWRCKVGTLCFIASRVQPGLSYTENVNIVVQKKKRKKKVIDCRAFFYLTYRAWIELCND